MTKSADFLGSNSCAQAAPTKTQSKKKCENEALTSSHVDLQLEKLEKTVKDTKPSETQEPAPKQEAAKTSENTKLGILLFALFCFLRASSYLCVDLLYRQQPEMSPWQMFFMRSCMGIVIMTIHQNKNLKKETWDSIELRKSGSLGFKTFAGIATNLIQFSVTKFIPATIISIVANTAPIIVLILAFLVLKEHIRKFDVAMIFATLVGIFVIIIGNQDAKSDKPEPSFPMWILYVLLFIYPCLSAGGIIAMRKMPKFSDAVVSWYLQWGTLICALVVILVQGEGFQIYANFGFSEWILAFFTGFTSVYSETVRFKALQLTQASTLQKLMPIITLFQWAFDISILGISYSWIQEIGLAYLGAVYIFQGVKYAVESKQNKNKNKVEPKAEKADLESAQSADHSDATE